MSYELTFAVPFNLKGVAGPTGGHHLYKCPLTPKAPATGVVGTDFWYHFNSATRVEIVSVSGRLVVNTTQSDKPAATGTAAVVGVDNPADSVHGLAIFSSIAHAGESINFEFPDSSGIRRVLKGVFDEGVEPAVHIAVSSTYDTSSHDIARGAFFLKCRFTGQDNNALYRPSLSFA